MLRKKGEVVGWFIGLRPTYQESYRAGEAMMDARATQLGIAGPRTLYGTRPGELMFDASPGLSSGAQILLSRSLSPEKFRGSLLAVLSQCHNPGVQLAELEELQKLATRWRWIDEPLWTTYPNTPSTVTARDSIQLYWAYLRALHRGVDASVRARTDAVLARHPLGDSERSSVLGRIQEVVGAGTRFERQRAARIGQSAQTILARAHDAVKPTAATLHLGNPICKSFLELQTATIQSTLDDYAALGSHAGEDRRNSSIDRVAQATAVLSYAQCFRSGRQQPRSEAALMAMIANGLKRPHPAQISDTGCLSQIESLRKQLANAAKQSTPNRHAQLMSFLTQLHSQRSQRCLVP